MNKKSKVLQLTLIIGIAVYFLDGLWFFFFSGENVTLFEALFTGVPPHEIIKRLFMVVIIVASGFYLTEKFNKIIIEHQISEFNNKKNRELPDSGFLAAISYQIRVPLTAIAGFSELLKDKDLTPESRELYIRHINSGTNFLLLLVKNFGDILKIESDKLFINSTECNVNKIMDDLLDEFQIRKTDSGKQNISVILNKMVKEDNLIILSDPERLGQVLNNLLENALSYTREGEIEFGYNIKNTKFLEFYVRNTGQGKSLENLNSIFIRYNKIIDDENLPFDGSVLRLSISKSLVKLLGGEIRAELKGAAETIIYFTLPFDLVENPSEGKLKTGSIPEITNDWSQYHVLIVEDIESNFIYLQEVLRPTKINIYWAKNGVEGVDFVKKNPQIDAVLMDILMPEMDGYEASKAIKKVRAELPVIAQTAFYIEDESDNEKTKYFDSYLTKPIWSPQLIAALEKYLT